jgi:hypothetical protein
MRPTWRPCWRIINVDVMIILLLFISADLMKGVILIVRPDILVCVHRSDWRD